MTRDNIACEVTPRTKLLVRGVQELEQLLTVCIPLMILFALLDL